MHKQDLIGGDTWKIHQVSPLLCNQISVNLVLWAKITTNVIPLTSIVFHPKPLR